MWQRQLLPEILTAIIPIAIFAVVHANAQAALERDFAATLSGDLLQILIVTFQSHYREVEAEQMPLPPPPRGFARFIGEGVVVELRTQVNGGVVGERILLQQRRD